MEYNCVLIKVDWLAACIALRVVSAVLVVFFRHWCKICTILQPMGNKGRYLKKCPKPWWPIRSEERWTQYTPTTLLSQRKLALTARNKLLHCKVIWAAKKFKNWTSFLIRPRSDLACHQKPNPCCEIVPLCYKLKVSLLARLCHQYLPLHIGILWYSASLIWINSSIKKNRCLSSQ